MPIRTGWCRLVPPGARGCRLVPIRTDSIWRKRFHCKPLSFSGAPEARFPAFSARFCPAVFAFRGAREAQNGPHRRAPLRRFDDALAANSCANARPAEAVPGSGRETRLWFSNSSRAHRAPSTFTGDVRRCARKGERTFCHRGRTPGHAVSRESAFFSRPSPPRPRPCARKTGQADGAVAGSKAAGALANAL